MSTVDNIEVCPIYAFVIDIDMDFQFLKVLFNFVSAGKLEKGAVMKAICSGFEETTEPAVCLSSGKFYHLLVMGEIYTSVYFLVSNLILFDW